MVETTKKDGSPVGGDDLGLDILISLRNVSKTYRLGGGAVVTAVRSLSLDVARREFIVITGRSGSGKTTVLNLAAGLIRPSSGGVLIEGVNLATLSDRRQSVLRNQKIGFIFQFPSLLPSLDALENVALCRMFGPGNKNEDAFERAAYLLEMVGLADKMHSLPRQLSAGQQKRVVVARAFMNRPQIILADEATADLDERTEEEILALLQEIHLNFGVTTLMVTHNRALVKYATRHLQMASGSLA